MLTDWDRTGRYVWLKRDLKKLFGEPVETFNDSLDRLVKAGILDRVARGVYVYAYSAHFGEATLDLIARNLRRGELTFESLESALSAYGVISQIPIDRRTYMTTGRSGEFITKYGVVELTHTSLPIEKILAGLTYPKDRGVPVASKEFAWRNLKAVRRNLDLVDEEELDEP
ncbi:hypothetical protein BBIA_2535 [Bifidobacterium biavatii DSM 23969]|uniref:AbiEi antitoxin N-terminal domain-containing protein n=2 Tax=Bifidobacterium biavatii TaxID=762212 RepID=A0A086Z5W4_9BIFI|nr:hypothetical protein BBIA_2535 [Bifidobacterium biavatii DSM 23969]